eukprot:2099886-Rhodomonas_salina.1
MPPYQLRGRRPAGVPESAEDEAEDSEGESVSSNEDGSSEEEEAQSSDDSFIDDEGVEDDPDEGAEDIDEESSDDDDVASEVGGVSTLYPDSVTFDTTGMTPAEVERTRIFMRGNVSDLYEGSRLLSVSGSTSAPLSSSVGMGGNGASEAIRLSAPATPPARR